MPSPFQLFPSVSAPRAHSDLLALDAANDLAGGVLGYDLVVVQHLKLLGGVAPHEVENGVDAAGVLLEPVGQVQDDALDDNPQVVLLVVLGNLLHGELLVGDGKGLGLAGGFLGGGGGGGLVGGPSGGGAGDGAVGPLDRQLAGSGGVEVQGDLAQALSGAGGALEGMLEEVAAGAVAGHAAVDDAAQQRGAAEAVGAVDAAGQLAAGKEALEGLLLLVEDLGLVVDLDAAHGEVEDGLHERDVEVVVDVEGQVVEELLAPGVLLLALGDGVVRLERLLEVLRSAANLLGELLARNLLHEAAAGVVARVEVQDVGGLGVEDEADGELVLVLLLPHHAGDVVAVAELIAEPVTVGVEEEAALAAQSLGGQELPLVAGVLGVDQAGGVDLDLVHVDAVPANSHDHLLAIARSVGAVSGSKAEDLGAVLLEQGALAKVGSVAAGGEDDGAVQAGGLAVQLIRDARDLVALLIQAGNAGLLDDLDPVWLGLGELLDALHQGIGDGHAGEFGIVASSGDQRQVEVEYILKPLDGSGGLVGQNLDEVWASLVTSRLQGVVVELLDAVADVVVNLSAGQGTVDAGSGLGRVAAEET
ncbi:hypothetical protein Trco_002788 [Trichoderma cornu-damae]|uniref:Uncharacterized protein n=1 Tax=Trichoderma cornu-damae TaxID=654480 RepID=A0A9P8TYU7_9HYPO|nr:hypothetical protein Trco_002788 [Trichoderma cornu-damae]